MPKKKKCVFACIKIKEKQTNKDKSRSVKNPAASVGDTNSIPGLGRSPGGRHGSPIQYSWLENPMDRGVW